MSLTLITAAPGAGKTLHAVWHIIKPAIEAGRVVYTVGIPDLKLPTIRKGYQEIKRWHERKHVDTKAEYKDDLIIDEVPTELLNIAEGSLIVIDEAQLLWPSSGAKDVGEDISYLSKHRHHGLEIVMITQSPQLIHNKVLAIVDKHIHMMQDWTGRRMFEWPEYCSSVRATANRMRAVTKRYDLPKEAFGLYRSASIHVKPQRQKPKMFYLLPIVLLGIPAIAYTFYTQVMSDRLAGTNTKDNVITMEEQMIAEVPIVHHEIKPVQSPTPTYERTQYAPRPVANTLVSDQVDWQRVSGCVSNKDKCICYGYSAERLVIPVDTCRLAVKHGWPSKPKPQPNNYDDIVQRNL